MTKVSRDRGNWPLTERQFECLEGFWARKTSKQIAIDLGISHHSVEKHLLACRERLGVTSSVEAAKLVFGGAEPLAVRPYYEAPELQFNPPADQPSVTKQLPSGIGSVTTKAVPINKFGAGTTLLLILAVALGSILAVAALIAAAQGVNELGRTIFQ